MRSSEVCSTRSFLTSSSATVSGNGDYASGNFTATQAGTYHWRASYSGDPNNNPAGPTACADPPQAVVVTKASPTLTTTATAPASAGGASSVVTAPPPPPHTSWTPILLSLSSDHHP